MLDLDSRVIGIELKRIEDKYYRNKGRIGYQNYLEVDEKFSGYIPSWLDSMMRSVYYVTQYLGEPFFMRVTHFDTDFEEEYFCAKSRKRKDIAEAVIDYLKDRKIEQIFLWLHPSFVNQWWELNFGKENFERSKKLIEDYAKSNGIILKEIRLKD